ncbi:ImmA/IrrE family metallo-endopeptidase [Ketobacter sp. MCCC 1A13808]|uniref:helix-turn-helix domain-containing protein n=1 Tax=Ketobacter sp. MCCC 1A13808 TaxID=2602738 RepID=UPI000F2D66EA|nr:short-chain fatty acyl-CoA regulator family protein [Ketobacter sp. MCCC 1A13808]MVF14168.1 ImmA/IrrE family metallo-endopeptidase [Ketobacter sp. MCCC 1A13808]RLP54077.1 MAG: XRE family transcriptional regulator [Ketobacter sp.]
MTDSTGNKRKHKLFLGNKIRRLREQHRLSQAELANRIGLSPSYLNQIENDQRPLTVQVLLKLGRQFDIELTHFSEEEDDRLVAEMRDCLEDPLFENEKILLPDLKQIVTRSPAFARHFLSLYQAYHQTKQDYVGLAEDVTVDEAVRSIEGPQFPYEEARDFFYYQNNYFDELDRAAEQLYREQSMTPGGGETQFIRYLNDQHHIRVSLDAEEDRLRRYDVKRKQLVLSRQLSVRQRIFHLAHQICLLDQKQRLDDIIAKARFTSAESDAVCRVGLANYFAGALLMPYSLFLKTAQQERYDIERLQIVFNVSFEQVCHRLSSLQRPAESGIPFYFLRVDAAGNISKRQSASSFHFARVGGACPLWNVHDAFAQPGKILRQVAQMPDGKTYFCIARTVSRTEGGFLMPQKNFAVALGCEIAHAPQLVYSVGIDLNDKEAAVPIGVSCRVCERTNCSQRAFPPIGKKIQIDENEREFLPYRFET